MYIRKTEDEFQIHGDYGFGFEEVTCEVSWSLAKDTLKAYRTNEPGIKFKIVRKRVKKEVTQYSMELVLAGQLAISM